MILTRIKRGAVRTAVLAHYRINQLQAYKPQVSWKVVQKTALSLMAARIVLLPVPFTQAAASASPVGGDDTDPSPRTGRLSQFSADALVFDPASSTLLVTSPQLQPVSAGKSLATEQEEAAATKAAEEAAAAAEAEAARVAAEKKAAEEARQRQVEAEQKKKQEAALAAIATQPTAVVDPGSDVIQGIILAAAAKYNVSGQLLLRIAKCESGYNPNARNRSSTAKGLFQFLDNTWKRATPQGAAGLSVLDPVAASEAAAWKIANGGLSAWNASKHCWNR